MGSIERAAGRAWPPETLHCLEVLAGSWDGWNTTSLSMWRSMLAALDQEVAVQAMMVLATTWSADHERRRFRPTMTDFQSHYRRLKAERDAAMFPPAPFAPTDDEREAVRAKAEEARARRAAGERFTCDHSDETVAGVDGPGGPADWLPGWLLACPSCAHPDNVAGYRLTVRGQRLLSELRLRRAAAGV